MTEETRRREIRRLADEGYSQLYGMRADKESLAWKVMARVAEKGVELGEKAGRSESTEEQRVSDYRSGCSCGYSDAKNGTRMRDKDAACLFFGITGIPDIAEPDSARPR